VNFDEFWNEINLARASEKFRSVISNSLEFNLHITWTLNFAGIKTESTTGSFGPVTYTQLTLPTTPYV
jgi:hypothetical protein